MSKSNSRKKWIIENVISLGGSLLIVFTIQSSIVQAFKIPSGSMIPTLYIGDHIFVNKFAYGLKVPFSDVVADRPVYLTHQELPKRSDVIVFIDPKDESRYLIKRVVGVPGDTVEMKDKVLYINQKMVSQNLIPAPDAEKILHNLNDPEYPIGPMDLYTENMDTHDHVIMIDKTNFRSESFGPVTVPPESLFAMGDNRDYSGDSRYWGFVPMKNVKGKAMVIWASFWVSFAENQFSFRLGRMGTRVR